MAFIWDKKGQQFGPAIPIHKESPLSRGRSSESEHDRTKRGKLVVQLPSLGHAMRLNSMIVMVVVVMIMMILVVLITIMTVMIVMVMILIITVFEKSPGRSTEGSKVPSQSPLRPCKHDPPGVDDHVRGRNLQIVVAPWLLLDCYHHPQQQRDPKFEEKVSFDSF